VNVPVLVLGGVNPSWAISLTPSSYILHSPNLHVHFFFGIPELDPTSVYKPSIQ